jgi:hypothetical protein
MSLVTSHLRFLTLRPAIYAEDNRLVIKTGFLARLLSLFLNFRKAEISPTEKTVSISHRMAYLFATSSVIDFADISHIDYGFRALGTDWGWSGFGYFGRQDQVESFAISIVTNDKTKHFLCAFRGEGAVCTGWTGMLLGDDDLVDFAGSQEDESRTFAKAIAKLVGVQIGEPMEAYDEMPTCPACGHPTSPHKQTCLYCGALLPEPSS